MALPDWVQIGGMAGAVGGVVAASVKGIVDVALTGMTGRQQQERLQREQQSQVAKQDADHEHQRAMLAQEAHFAVRAELAVLAGRAMDWAAWALMEGYGEEEDLSSVTTPLPAYREPRDAISDLRTIRATHPTAAVRAKARELSLDIESMFNEIVPPQFEGRIASLDHMLRWNSDAEDLADLINQPPGRP